MQKNLNLQMPFRSYRKIQLNTHSKIMMIKVLEKQFDQTIKPRCLKSKLLSSYMGPY